jgi:hypothetical integral membrane protein (TIGR02206 family)
VRQFSPEHLVALAVLAGAIVVAVRAPRAIPRRGLAALILGAFLVEYAVNASQGRWDWGFNLPLQLSDVVALLAPVALWTGMPLLVEVVYFWGLTASLQAVLTPSLNEAFPSVFYFTYFATHCGVVVAACLLVFGLGLRPRPGAVRRAFAATLLMAAAAGLGDLLTGGDYMYLRAKPADASLLSVMGPWPVYIATAAVLALLLFAALYRLSVMFGSPSESSSVPRLHDPPRTAPPS